MNLLAQDLDHVLQHTSALWDELRGQRIFITGGTGFFGCWLLESFAWANERLELGAEAVVLSRAPALFAAKVPHLAANPAIKMIEGDVTSFAFPAGKFDCVIHAAVEYSPPLELCLNAIEATRRTLDFAVSAGARRYLYTSSGAIYGRQSLRVSHVAEDNFQGPDPTLLRSAYGEAKRVSEFLCAAYADRHGLVTLIARGFAFVGPYLALDKDAAIGNFIGDALSGQTINVNGDGTPLRSYLYGADLAIWLWTVLLKGESLRAYNVGGEESYSIAAIARLVAEEVNPKSEVEIARAAEEQTAPERYVPSTARARSELGLREWISLRDGIRKTAAWHKERRI